MPEIPAATQFFATLDTLDVDAIAAFYAPHAAVQLPGGPVITARAAIRQALLRFSLAVDDLRHECIQLWSGGELTIFEADLTVTPAGRAALTFPVTHVLRWAAGRIVEQRVSLYLESRLALALASFERIEA